MMRMWAGALLLSFPFFASSETLLVAPASHLCAGQKVDKRDFSTLMSTTQKCKLPIINAERMLTFNEATPRNAIVKTLNGNGCWGISTTKRAVFIYEDGRTYSEAFDAYAKVSFDEAGSGVVIDSPVQNMGRLKCPQP
ncbi:hypothetical protein KNHN1_17950 [Pseudomonas guariconensis]|uniref:hypothetical protein n=1 Tax=Pseudomonas guariconensis TaxID=1288410 RepID=UPI0036F19EF5